MGAAVGVAAWWLMLRRDEPRTDLDERALADQDLAAVRPAVRRERRRANREINLDALAGRLRSHGGTEHLRVRSLGQGIIELVGNAAGPLDVPTVIKALAEEPGVSVVVNRVWTPESAASS